VVKHKGSCKVLQQTLRQKLFHPDTLHQAQKYLYAERAFKELMARDQDGEHLAMFAHWRWRYCTLGNIYTESTKECPQ
jgi:hypothetical protein